jgi:DNA-binding GntR family transcriptional regulator
MGRRPIERTENVTSSLEADIIEGQLLPGERLEERTLAERFGVSRTPIREALRRLSASGLVEEQAGSGCIVARISMPELFEIFEFVNELEACAARLAAERIDAEMAAQLKSAAEDCVRIASTGKVLSYSRANLRFHEILYKASRNRFLESAIRQVSARAAVFRRQALSLPGWVTTSAQEHVAIAEAVVSHDQDQAERLMAAHMDIFHRKDFPRFVALLSEQMSR